MSTLELPPVEWDEMSLFEQLALLPEAEADVIIGDLVRRGVDLTGPEVMLRPDQLEIVNDDAAWIALFSAGRGAGKALALDTMIPTPTGWSKMGEVVVGDRVVDERGRPCNVTAVFDTYAEKAWRLTFSDGTYLDACSDHQWVTLTASERKWLNRRGLSISEDWADKTPIDTATLVATLRRGSRGDRNHAIPVTAPIDLPEANLLVDPWVLGAWLGDGSSATAEITMHDDDAVHLTAEAARRGVEMRMLRRRHADRPVATWALGAKLNSQRDPVNGRMVSNGSLHSKFRALGVLNAKHVPQEYLRASATQRLDLLRGLIDTDGHVDAKGLIEFCSTKRVLAEAVTELARSLGQKPVFAEGVATLDGRVIGPKYRVTWRPTVICATLPRKVEAHRPLSSQSMRSAHRMVVSAEPIDPQPMRCITVDSPNSMYLAGEGMIPTHNTRTGAGWVNERAEEFPGCQIILLGRTVADVRDVMINGEALALNTPVATPEGFTTMGEVRPGDLVLGSDGEPTKVLWVSEIHHDRPCYKVTFKDGESIIADAEHKWTTWTHQARRFRSTPGSKHQPAVVTTEQIRETLIHQKQLNHAICNIDPIGGDDLDLPIPPYTFGAWLGDGHTHHAAVTTMDPEVLEGIIADGFRIREWPSAVDGGQASTYGILGLSALLKLAGLLANKHVPEIYFRASYRQRLRLLQGLIDTDGSVSADGQVEFGNTNEALADGVIQLVATLGMRASKTVRPGSDGKKPFYRVQFRTGVPVATIQRKKDRLRTPASSEWMYRYIKSVEPADSVPVRCIAVDADDHLFAVGRTLVMTHNSGIINTAPRDFVPVYTPSLRRLEWPNGSTAMTFSADSPSQLRGPQGHFAWADELAAFPIKPDSSGATAWDNCLLATRLGDHPQLLVTTTPKRTGVMRDLYRMAENDKRVTLHTSSTLSNRTNLSPEYIQAIFDRYAGTHLEMQELFGELVGDAPGALWRSGDIVLGSPPEMDLRTITVIGVDPAVEAGGDNTGIVLARGTREPAMSDRKAWVLEDRTMDGAPDEWASEVHALWVANPGSVVVVEGNQGGQLLKMVLHQLDPSMPVAIVKAITSKSARAEPIVMAYRQRRVQHIANFPLLEEEMTGWEPEVSRWSPGSVDALVWALSVLLVDERPLYPYMPVMPGPASVETLPGLVPSYRGDRAAGMAVAPWRRH